MHPSFKIIIVINALASIGLCQPVKVDPGSAEIFTEVASPYSKFVISHGSPRTIILQSMPFLCHYMVENKWEIGYIIQVIKHPEAGQGFWILEFDLSQAREVADLPIWTKLKMAVNTKRISDELAHALYGIFVNIALRSPVGSNVPVSDYALPIQCVGAYSNKTGIMVSNSYGAEKKSGEITDMLNTMNLVKKYMSGLAKEDKIIDAINAAINRKG